MASATRRGKGQSPACARKTLSRATGNSCWRSSSLVSISFKVIASGAASERLLHDLIQLIKITRVKVDDLVRDIERNAHINKPGHKSGEEENAVYAFLLIVIMEPLE